METIKSVLDIGHEYDPVEMKEFERVTTAFEFCETLDEVRLRHLQNVVPEEETGAESLRVWWPKEDDGRSQQAYMGWDNADSPIQSMRHIVLESLEGSVVTDRIRLELMADGRVTFFVEGVHPEPIPASLKDIVTLRRELSEEGVYSQAA